MSSARWAGATRSGSTGRRLERLEDFNLTTDVIVGFPTEDERAFANTMTAVEATGITKVHVFPYSPRPGTRTAGDDPVPQRVKKDRSARLRAASDAACRARWSSRVGSEDVVLVDRPGLGYADDYTPWLVDAPIGEMVRARAVGVARRGGARRCRSLTASSAASSRTATTSTPPTASSRSGTSPLLAETHLLVLPERHVDTFREIDAFPDEEAGRMLRFVAEVAAAEGLEDYRVIVNVGPRRGADRLPSPLARPRRKCAPGVPLEPLRSNCGKLCPWS